MSLPIIRTINNARQDLYQLSLNQNNAKERQLAGYIGHKFVSVISLKANLIGLSLGACGALTCALTLGTSKIAIITFSGGYFRPEFSSGTQYFFDQGISCAEELGRNICELTSETSRAIKLIAHVAVVVLVAVGTLVAVVLDKTVIQLGRNVGAAVTKANAEEAGYVINFETPRLIAPLDDIARDSRLDFANFDRSFKTIGTHYVTSFVNIPANTLIALCSGIALAVLGTVYINKVMTYTFFNETIPVSTYAGKVGEVFLVSSANVAKDLGTDVVDVFYVSYKTIKTLGFKNLAFLLMLALNTFFEDDIDDLVLGMR